MIFLSKPAGRDLASSGVVGFDAIPHSEPPKELVSRALRVASLRNKDFRLLGVLTRSVLERLD
jgi:hypothetical protein